MRFWKWWGVKKIKKLFAIFGFAIGGNNVEGDVSSPYLNCVPMKFIPHDGGFFSNFNFMVGEIHLGRRIYPLYSLEELERHSGALKHFAYASPDVENSWFRFFQPLRYEQGDELHLETETLAQLEGTLGLSAPEEFRIPAATIALYGRADFQDWRRAVNRSIQGLFSVTDEIRATIDSMAARMPAYKIGVHIRHPSHLVEQGCVYYKNYFEKIDVILERHPEAAIFIATDNDLALAVFAHRYGQENIYSYEGFIRESIDDVMAWVYALVHSKIDDMGFIDGVGFQTHYRLTASGDAEAGIRNGIEAVTDLFTLALCDEFVCTASNFTLASAYLNPEQKQHLVSGGANT